MQSSHYNDNVFLNCPFDSDYKQLFDAMVFAVHDCGFIARCALEEGDASQVRIDKIYDIIADCRYGIHDISRTELDAISSLPRFNMPLELGVFLGAKRFGINGQERKNCLILDKEQYRYQQFISDIAGQDVAVHNNNPKKIVTVVRVGQLHVNIVWDLRISIAKIMSYFLFRMSMILAFDTGNLIVDTGFQPVIRSQIRQSAPRGHLGDNVRENSIDIHLAI